MPWLWLFIAGLFETAWAVGLKYSDGFTRFWPSVYTLATMAVSIFLLSVALRNLPVGTAYAVWTGIGAVGTALYGILVFDESRSVLRLLCIVLIITGLVGLRLFSK
jgi:quaternary ammonium compound-resistance protein SugE